jgi:protein involved in polysaccharide export with SLBB domain
MIWAVAWCVPAMAATSTNASVSPSAGKNEPTNEVYRLGPGDVLDLRVYREEDLDSKAVVSPEGTVQLQLLGTVKVAGLTIAQAAQTIQDLYGADYLVNPHLVLDLVATNKLEATEEARLRKHFIVLGQVNKPGTFDLREDETINLIQAIAVAGGYTRLGAPSKITVTRLEEGRPKVIKLNADSMLKDKNKPFEIQPDDIITVGEKFF